MTTFERVDGEQIRVLRLIARLNVGGAAKHVSLLAGHPPPGYAALLAFGELGSGELPLDMDRMPATSVRQIKFLGPAPNPARDLLALREIRRLIATYRPHIVETHTAKAGLIGRTAAWSVSHNRPAIIHVYHGHVLEGYFAKLPTAALRLIDRSLARISDRLVAVSDATVDDLVRLKVAPRSSFRVLRIGVDLDPFRTVDPRLGAELRQSLGWDSSQVVFAFVGRLVPIKRVDLALRALSHLARGRRRAKLLIAGDGPSRSDLERVATDLGVSEDVRFLGHRTDVPAIASAADIGLLTSDNEGTPTWLIEAAAAAVPAVARAVGGVKEVLGDRGGVIVDSAEPADLAQGMKLLAESASLRESCGRHAQRLVSERFDANALPTRVAAIYGEVLRSRRM